MESDRADGIVTALTSALSAASCSRGERLEILQSSKIRELAAELGKYLDDEAGRQNQERQRWYRMKEAWSMIDRALVPNSVTDLAPSTQRELNRVLFPAGCGCNCVTCCGSPETPCAQRPCGQDWCPGCGASCPDPPRRTCTAITDNPQKFTLLV